MYHAHFAAIIGVKPFTVVVFYVGGSVELDAAFAAHHALDFAIGRGTDIGGRAADPSDLAHAIGIGHAFAFCLCHVCAQTQQQGQGQGGFESLHRIRTPLNEMIR